MQPTTTCDPSKHLRNYKPWTNVLTCRREKVLFWNIKRAIKAANFINYLTETRSERGRDNQLCLLQRKWSWNLTGYNALFHSCFSGIQGIRYTIFFLIDFHFTSSSDLQSHCRISLTSLYLYIFSELHDWRWRTISKNNVILYLKEGAVWYYADLEDSYTSWKFS